MGRPGRRTAAWRRPRRAVAGAASAAGLLLALAAPGGGVLARQSSAAPACFAAAAPAAASRRPSPAAAAFAPAAASRGRGGGPAAAPRRREAGRRRAGGDVVELPPEELVEVEGEYAAALPEGRLAALRAKFPTLNVSTPGLRLVNDDPPIFVLEGLIDDGECEAFRESMRQQDGTFPERLGQSNLPGVPSFLNPLKTAMRGLPVLDWLGNPTVRWTYKSRGLLSDLLDKVRRLTGLDMEAGAANIKHYREDQWLPTHIDYNHATLMATLNDVDDGGHTLFPTLGIKVKPRRGNALVWPNQPPLKHAGDRVVRGEKWILFYNWPAEQNWEYDDNFEFNDF